MATAGTSGAFLAMVYALTDVLQHGMFLKLSRPFVWLGLNSMTGTWHATYLRGCLCGTKCVYYFSLHTPM